MGMTINQPSDVWDRSLWQVAIEGEEYYTATIATIEKWATDNQISCIISPGVSYFYTEQDAMFFVLRWA